MNYRPHGGKHTLALWMLVALTDGALVVSSGGALSRLLLALAVAVVPGVAVTLRLMLRRAANARAAITQGRRSWQLARAEAEGLTWHESRA